MYTITVQAKDQAMLTQLTLFLCNLNVPFNASAREEDAVPATAASTRKRMQKKRTTDTIAGTIIKVASRSTNGTTRQRLIKAATNAGHNPNSVSATITKLVGGKKLKALGEGNYTVVKDTKAADKKKAA